MLTITLIVLAVLAAGVGGILVVAATRPDDFSVQRTASIKAPPEKIFPFINDFRNWTLWSPFEKVDPAMKRTFGTVAAGPGATYAWEGNKNIGAGSMTMVDSSPSKLVLRLDFVRPFKANNLVEFALVPAGDATNVTWLMRGPVPYFFKIVHMFMNMDKMCGDQFVAGLTDLKTAAER